MEFNEIVVTAILSIITGISGMIYGQKKQNLDLQAQSYDNILKQIGIYEVIIDNLRQEVHSLITKVEEQQRIIHELELSVEELCKIKR